jgi:hypothetical protein
MKISTCSNCFTNDISSFSFPSFLSSGKTGELDDDGGDCDDDDDRDDGDDCDDNKEGGTRSPPSNKASNINGWLTVSRRIYFACRL